MSAFDQLEDFVQSLNFKYKRIWNFPDCILLREIYF